MSDLNLRPSRELANELASRMDDAEGNVRLGADNMIKQSENIELDLEAAVKILKVLQSRVNDIDRVFSRAKREGR